MKKIFMTVLYSETHGPVSKSRYLHTHTGGVSGGGARRARGMARVGGTAPGQEDDEVDELGFERDAPR